MPRIAALDPAKASGPAKDLLDAVHQKMGKVPNMMRTMAHAPATLKAYLSTSEALGHGSLNGKVREAIALAVGDANRCEYCVSAHTVLGKMHGLSQDETVSVRQGNSSDPQVQAAARFALAINEKRGRISDADFAAVKAAGFSDGQIAEIVANVALNILTNYFNDVAGVETDFPKVALLSRSG